MSSVVGKLRYAATELTANYQNLTWWSSRFEQRIIAPVQEQIYGSDGIDVMDEDWDTLIILDACRADLFEQTVDTNQFDRYQRVSSAGSSTPEWTQKNFSDQSFGDTVYVTSNPQTSKYAGGSFHELVEVWDGAFDDGDRTIYPDDMADAALEAHKSHPDKRLIVHFMQPHPPFINRDQFFNTETVTDEYLDEVDAELKALIDLTSRDRVWDAFEDNLDEALPYVWELCEKIPGKTVISADHGDLLGEFAFPFPVRLYGHPTGIRQSELTSVPWAVFDGERREIVEEDTTRTRHDMDKIDDHLRNLGYK